MSLTANAQKLNAKFSPLSLLDPSTPTFFIGGEIRLNHRWALELDYGIKTNTGIFSWNENKTKLHYFKLRSEVKYYIPLRKNNMYVGIAFFFIPSSYNNNTGTYYDRSDTKYRYDKAHITKDIYGLCVKAGYVKNLSKRFSCELFAGYGVRYIQAKLTNLEGKVITNEPGEWIQTSDFEGRQERPHLEIGIKINYSIIK